MAASSKRRQTAKPSTNGKHPPAKRPVKVTPAAIQPPLAQVALPQDGFIRAHLELLDPVTLLTLEKQLRGELEKISNKVDRRNTDVEALIQLQFDEMQRLQDTVSAGMRMVIAAVQEQLATFGKAVQPTNKKEKGPPARKRKQLVPSDDFTLVTKEEACWGEDWEHMVQQPLTQAEKNWSVLFPYLIQKYHIHNPTLLVYGWHPTWLALWQIFHHLNVKRIGWIHTYNRDDNLVSAINRVVPTNGRIVLLNSFIGQADYDGHREIQRRCEVQMPRMFCCRLPKSCNADNTHVVADTLLTAIFRRDWNDLAPQLARD